MYQVFKQVWHKDTQQYWLTYVSEYPNLDSARLIARKVKGVVKINGTICLDLRR